MDGQERKARWAADWGPVCRGYEVVLPDGRRGFVEEIRIRDGEVELIVAAGLFVRRHLTVGANDIESILPAASRIVVRWSDGDAAANGEGDLEAAGGIVRMPVLHSLRASLPEDAR